MINKVLIDIDQYLWIFGVCVCIYMCVPLVVGHGHGANGSIAAWISEELFEIMELPYSENPPLSSAQQVLTILTQ